MWSLNVKYRHYKYRSWNLAVMLRMTSPEASLTWRSFTNPHETMSVPKSGSIIWDKAFNTSLVGSLVETAETPDKRETKLDFDWYRTIVFRKNSSHPTNQGKIENGASTKNFILDAVIHVVKHSYACITTFIVNPRKMLCRNSLNSVSTSVFYGLQTLVHLLCSFLLEDMS